MEAIDTRTKIALYKLHNMKFIYFSIGDYKIQIAAIWMV